MTEYPVSLRPEYLMEHMQAVCKGIGPRPPTSNEERQAADYVERMLRRSDITNIQRQLFKSPNSLGWSTIPCLVAGVLATVISRVGGQWGKLVSSALLIGSAYIFLQYLA